MPPAYPALPVAPDRRIPRVLSIAGSDSGGGAGIQADLKAFARCGVHGMTAITAITAQNTVAVTAVHPLPPRLIVEQVRAVADDIGVDAVKIGMLGTAETIEAVSEALDLVRDAPVVLDPVMVAESGARLLDEDAQEALSDAPGAARGRGHAERAGGARAGRRSGPDAGPEELARAVHALGPAAVVVTGGHREAGGRRLLRRRAARGDPRRALPGRRGPRVRLHPLLGARGAPCARARAARGRAAQRSGSRPRRCATDCASVGEGPGSGRRVRPAPASAAAAAGTGGRRARRDIIDRPPRWRPHPHRLEQSVPAHEARVMARCCSPRAIRACARTRSAWSRSSAASSTRACGPRCPVTNPGSGRREAQMVKEYADIPAGAERVIFFPRASGG